MQLFLRCDDKGDNAIGCSHVKQKEEERNGEQAPVLPEAGESCQVEDLVGVIAWSVVHLRC